MTSLLSGHLEDCSTPQYFCFSIRCEVCGEYWYSSSIPFSKAAQAAQHREKKELYDAIYQREKQRAMQAASRIPLLLACNLESGGNGVAVTGTFFGREMEVAATGETEQARRLGVVCAREGAAAGCNWAFSPIVDIDYNWRNPITNVRTFGSDPDMVIEMSKAFMDGVRETGADLAVTIKHFPGDGVDERDQHLLTSVNDCTCEEWDATYGAVWPQPSYCANRSSVS